MGLGGGEGGYFLDLPNSQRGERANAVLFCLPIGFSNFVEESQRALKRIGFIHMFRKRLPSACWVQAPGMWS